jgi:LacI family transcriptional regulator
MCHTDEPLAPCIVQGMPVRMKDIAKDLGLSVVTISKVLRDHPDISEETRARVLKHVKDCDYQPNILARSLVTGHSYLIGLIVPDLIHPFFAEIAKALSAVIRPRGYSLIISSSDEDAGLESQELRQLLARQLDALVIASTAMSGDQFDQLVRNGPPYVLIDRAFPGQSSNFVGIDDVAAGRIATEHLISSGCRRIAHISGRSNSTGIGRLEGYKQALLRHRISYSKDYVISRTNVDTDSRQQGAEAMRLLLQRNPPPDGVFCYNDPLAIGAMDAILDAGFRIPADIAIIGCGNLHYDSALRIPLSSIDQHSQLIGRRAGEIVLDLIESKEKQPARSVILEPTLVARSSTRVLENVRPIATPEKKTPVRKALPKKTSKH